MAIIPGLISHLRHYNAAREQFQRQADSRERTSSLDFGGDFDLGDADMISRTMRQYGISLPEIPAMPRPQQRSPLSLDPQDYRPKPKG